MSKGSLIGLPAQSATSEHLHLCGGTRAQERHVTRDRKETHAAFGERDRALGAVTIGAGDFPRLLCRSDDALELAFNVIRKWIKRTPLRQRDRKIGWTEEEAIDPGHARDRIEVIERSARLNHREAARESVGVGEIFLLIGDAAQHGSAVRPPASFADRRIFR